MNVFKALYCNQYYELEPQGKADTAKKMGTVLNAVAIMLILLSIFFLLLTFVPDFERELNKMFKSAFGRRSGRAVGKFVGLAIVALAFPVIRYTLGTEKSYQNIIAEFKSKSAEEQAQISKKGLQFFIRVIVLIAISFLMVIGKLILFD
ncbi:DUF3784 domain-containing protein [Seonamhaeicola sp. MEBiC1930]|uniref:hypothetical protein n=1 Tax=Seonamhaeicola sp. MEBiC01930 TaxID=2976768 RepID=UPI003246CB91